MVPIPSTARPPRAATDTVSDAPAAKPLRVLVADDNNDGREMLVYLLTAEGHTVAAAPDGPTAIETARVFHPDVVILDIGMPGMNGYTVARSLRAKHDAPGLVLVALSGSPWLWLPSATGEVNG